MNKRKQSFIKSSKNNEPYLLSKMSNLLDKSIPNTIDGMLATAQSDNNELVFYNRYRLISDGSNDYRIQDDLHQTTLYKNISLFSSAVNMIYSIKKNIINSGYKDQWIYRQDQQYYRCMQNINHYRQRLKVVTDHDRRDILANRLETDLKQLQEIKNVLFKIFR